MKAGRKRGNRGDKEREKGRRRVWGKREEQRGRIPGSIITQRLVNENIRWGIKSAKVHSHQSNPPPCGRQGVVYDLI